MLTVEFMRVSRRYAVIVELLALANWAGLTARAQDAQTLIAGITNASADVRAEAWKKAGPAGAAAVGPLGLHLDDPDPGTKKAARAALTNIVTYAGRPGAAPAEGPAVAAELTKLLDGKTYPEATRREALNALSLIGGDAEVSAIAALLADPALGDDARMALERIPGAVCEQALIAALDTAPDELKAHIAATLGTKSAQEAVKKLVALARTATNADVLWSCVEAAARLGVPPSQVVPRKPSFTHAESIRYLNAFLVAGKTLADQGKRNEAERVYTSIASFYDLPSQAAGAIRGLAEMGSEKLIPHAMGNLDTPELRTIAIEVLTASKLEKVEETLVRAYELTSPASRSAIVAILDGRKSPRLAEVLAKAEQDASPEVRLAAARAKGQAPSESDLLEVATKGYPWSWEPALRTYLEQAGAQVASGDREGARAKFEKVVTGSFPTLYKVQALDGLGLSASPASRELVKGLMADPDLGVAAGRAYAAICAADSNKDQAIKDLFELAGQTASNEVVTAAMQQLKTLGADAQRIPKEKGFVAVWRLLGPFPNPDGKGAFGKSFLPEAEADGIKRVQFEGAEMTWQDVVAEQMPASIDLRAILRPNTSVAAYAYTEVGVDAETPVLLLFGSNDGCGLWVNGQKVHQVEGGRSMQMDGDRIPATLKPGVNKILVKVLQGGGAWEFCLRLADPSGKPLDLTTMKLLK